MLKSLRSFSRVSLVAAGLLAAGLAAAQGPWYGKLTLGTPTSSDLSDGVSGLAYGAGVGYSVWNRIPNLRLGAELNYTRADGHDNWFHAFDLMAVGRYDLGASRIRPYVGLGAGVTYSEAHADGNGTPTPGPVVDSLAARDNPFDSATSSRTRGLWTGVIQPVVGIHLNERSFAEIAYRISPDLRGVNQNILTVSYGLRF